MNLQISAPNHKIHFAFGLFAAIAALAGMFLILWLASPLQAVTLSAGQPAAGQVMSGALSSASPQVVAVPTPPQAVGSQAQAARLSATPIPGVVRPVTEPAATPRLGQ